MRTHVTDELTSAVLALPVFFIFQSLVSEFFCFQTVRFFFKTFPQLKIQRFAVSSCTKFMRFLLFLLGSSSRLAFFHSFHFQNLLKTKDSRTVTSWVRLVIRIFCFSNILPSSFAFGFYGQLSTDRRKSKLFDVTKQKPSQATFLFL